MSEPNDMLRDCVLYGADLLSTFANWLDENKESFSQLKDDLFSRLDECKENHDRREYNREDEADCVDKD